MNRRFQPSWYKDRSWLEYSVRLDKAFCFACRHFALETWAHYDRAFAEHGINKWRKALEKFQKHQTSTCHIRAMTALVELREGVNQVETILDSQRALEESAKQKKAKENRQFLATVVDILLFLARQNIAIRGHDESDISANKGNFLELVSFVASYNSQFKLKLEEVQTKCRNAMYLSPDIQNELIDIAAGMVREIIVKEVKEAGIFSIGLDETSDVSRQEQVAFILRYVDSNGEIQERLLEMKHINSTTASSLLELMKNVFDNFGLELSSLRGQFYDGAVNMSGQYNGLQAKVREKNQSALYVHCYAHSLNLVLVKAITQNQISRNFFGVVQSLYNFIAGSSKRHDLFIKMQKEREISHPVTLKALSDTRWACRVDALHSLNIALAAVLDTLEAVAEDSETDSVIVGEANGLISSVNSFEFVLLLTVMADILAVTNTLNMLLQQKKQDLLNANRMVKATLATLDQYRSEDSWKKFWERAATEAQQQQINIPKDPPQRHRRVPRRIDNCPSTQYMYASANEFYRVTFYYPVIDMLQQELMRRFDQEALKAIDGIAALDPSNHFEAFSEGKIIKFATCFPMDIPDISALAVELTLFLNYIKHTDFATIQELYKYLVKNKLYDSFPLSSKIYKIALTLPVTTVSNERSFSLLKIIKNRLRSTMGESRLSSLCVLIII